MNPVRNRLVAISASVAVILTLLGAPTAVVANTESKANSIVVRPDFAGVLAAGETNPAGESVSWYGTADGGVHVLWASAKVTEITDSKGQPTPAEYSGNLSSDQISNIGSRLSTVGSEPTGPSAAVFFCSLVVVKPFVDLAANPDRAVGSTQISCLEADSTRATDDLLRQLFLFIYPSVASADSGFKASNENSATAFRNCVKAKPHSWKNRGHGEALNDGVFFNGPTITTDAVRLGCS